MPGWPTVPPIIYTDRVKVRAVTWTTKDRTGGRVPTYGSWSGSSYACSVTATTVQDAPTSDAQSVVTHVVTSDTKLAGLRDQLQWQETGATLTIVGIKPVGDGNGRLWNHYAEEFIAH